MPLLVPLWAFPFFLFILALSYIRDPPAGAKPLAWAMLVLSLPALVGACLMFLGPLLGASNLVDKSGAILRRFGLYLDVAGFLIFVVIRAQSQQDWSKETLAVLLSVWLLFLMLIVAMGA